MSKKDSLGRKKIWTDWDKVIFLDESSFWARSFIISGVRTPMTHSADC